MISRPCIWAARVTEKGGMEWWWLLCTSTSPHYCIFLIVRTVSLEILLVESRWTMRKNSVEMAEASGVCKLCAPAPVPIPAPSPMEPYTWSPIRARCKEDQFAPHQEAAGLTGLPRLTAIHSSAGQSSQHYTTGQLPSQWPLLLIGAHRKCGIWRHP